MPSEHRWPEVTAHISLLQGPWEAALSSGMEPETVLWGPDLQDAEQSPSTARRGEGLRWASGPDDASGPSPGRESRGGQSRARVCQEVGAGDSLSLCRCRQWERRGEPPEGKFWGGDHPGRSSSESRIQGPTRDALPGPLSPPGLPHPSGSPQPLGLPHPRGRPFPL